MESAELREVLERIVSLEREFVSAELSTIRTSESRSVLFKLISEKSTRCVEITNECNNLLDTKLYPLLNDFQSITDEQDEILSEYAEFFGSIATHLDSGLAYLIRCALLSRAKYLGDERLIIKQLYYKGMAVYYLDKVLFNDELDALITEGVSFLDKYEGYDSETRRFLCRLLGNYFMVRLPIKKEDPSIAIERGKRAMAFYNDSKITAMNPEFPWKRFIYVTHENFASMLDKLRMPELYSKELAKVVYDSAVFMVMQAKGFLSKEQFDAIDTKIKYSYSAAAYHYGKISLEKLCDSLYNLYRSSDKHDYSSNGLYTNIFLPAVYTEYLTMLPEGHPKRSLGVFQSVSKSILDYSFALEDDASVMTANEIVNSLVEMMLGGGFTAMDGYLEALLQLSVYRHLPIYVHSVVVGEIAKVFATYFMKKDPAFLLGLNGAQSVEELLESQDEVFAHIRLIGLTHDIGKIRYTTTLSLYPRRLFDKELEMIALHSVTGKKILASVDDKSDLAEVAEGHHKWYDDSAGYPTDFSMAASKLRNIISIIAVADSIDAATDDTRRSYAKAKPIEDVISEIQGMAGTRYCPVCAEALADKGLVSEIKELLGEFRATTYAEACARMHFHQTGALL